MLIFNFHHVEENLRHPDRKIITITPDGLRNFIHTLRLLGMEIISMRDILDPSYVTKRSAKHVLLTFDDGYVNNYEYAAPILKEENCPATIFILPGRFGGTNEWDQGHLPEEERDKLMSLEQIQSLGQSSLITFGSHGMMHRDMTRLSDRELRYEIHQSYDILINLLPESFVPVLAYPWGSYSSKVVLAMQNSPYRYGFTVEPAQWLFRVNHFQIPRYTAYFRDGNPVIFVSKLCRHKLLFA